jgi:Secretion system C-terminal sorting domain
MFRRFSILLFVLFSAEVFGQFLNDNFTISYPDYIPANKDFEVSIITSKVYAEAEILKLNLTYDNNIKLIKADLKTQNENSQIVFNPSDENGSWISKIDLKDSLFTLDNFFQILLKFSAGSQENSGLDISGEFLKDDLLLGRLETNDERVIERNPANYNLNLEFYQPTKLANQLCKFPPNSQLEIPLKFDFSNQLVINFWFRAEKNNISFCNIRDKNGDRVIYSLLLNRNQVLSAQSDIYSQINLTPKFISLNDWYSISVLINKEYHSISFLLNGMEFSKLDFPDFIDPANLIIELFNSTKSTTFSIDQFRVIDAEEEHSDIFSNCTFKDFNPVNSKLLLQINFNDVDIYSLLNNSTISFSNIKISPSNAPIFQRAPYLNLTTSNNFYELDWESGDYKNAEFYLVERSTGESDFDVIQKIQADKNQDKKYSYIAEKIVDAEVIYFRIEQVNSDGSKIYSPVVKVGQGLVEDVILEQNFPNPFNPSTKIEFELLQDGDVQVVVYNLEGKEVSVLHKGFLSKGKYQFEFNGSELPSGIYLYKVSTSQFTQTQKMILAK